MVFFSRGRNGQNNRGRRNWNWVYRRPQFSIHFNVDPQELNWLFQARFFNLVDHGILYPWLDRPSFHPPHNFPGILIPPHVSLQPEVPANDGWKEIVHQPISHHCGWPTVSFPLPPPINSSVQIAPIVLPVQSFHASNRSKIDIPQPVKDKGKATTSPSSPSTKSSNYVSSCLHLKYECSHVISEIKPQGSNQPRETQGKSVGDNSEKRKYASQSSKYGS